MKTVNAEVYEPKTDCWAYADGKCKIMKDEYAYCRQSKCGHYQTKQQHKAKLEKANQRLQSLGYAVKAQKNNRVSGN